MLQLLVDTYIHPILWVVIPFSASKPISRERLAELADTLEQEAADRAEPDWHNVMAIGRELLRGGRAQARRSGRRRRRV